MLERASLASAMKIAGNLVASVHVFSRSAHFARLD